MSMRGGVATRDGNLLEPVFPATAVTPPSGCGGLGGTIAYDSYPRTLQATLGGGFVLEGFVQYAKDPYAIPVEYCPAHITFAANAVFNSLPVILFNPAAVTSRACTAGYQIYRILRQNGGRFMSAIWDGPGNPQPCDISRWCGSNIQIWIQGSFTLSADLIPNGGHLFASFSLYAGTTAQVNYVLDVTSFPFGNSVHLELPPTDSGIIGFVPGVSGALKTTITRSELQNLTLDFNLNQS